MLNSSLDAFLTHIRDGLMPCSNEFSYPHQPSLNMTLSHSRFGFHVLVIPLIILGIVNPCAGATFNAKTQFSWVDSSCDSVIDQVNNAGDDYNALVKAAIAKLEGGSPSTELGKATLQAYFGTPVGQLVNAKYERLQSSLASQPIAVGLYCDGSAFEWVTTYQEGERKGQPIPKGGQWHAKEGRYNPAEGPLYLDGTKTPQRTDICQTPEGENEQGVSSVGGKHIILCPNAFKEPVLGTIPTSEQTIGASLDTLISTGAVLLHEATHCILNTTDITGGYKVNGVIMKAKISSAAQTNADSWMYYAMASLVNKNAWVLGLAQATDNFGAPKAPPSSPSNGKRALTPTLTTTIVAPGGRKQAPNYQVGDQVWLNGKNISTRPGKKRDSKKLDDKMIGPFRITAKYGSSYVLDLPNTIDVQRTFDVSLLRKNPDTPLLGQTCSPTCLSTITTCSANGTATTTTGSGSSANNTFQTVAIYTEVCETVPLASVSAVVASWFPANSTAGDLSSTSGTAPSTSIQNSQPASTTSSSTPASTTPPTTSAPSTAPPPTSTPAFSCRSL